MTTNLNEDLLNSEYNKGYSEGFNDAINALFDALRNKMYQLPTVSVVQGCDIINDVELCKIMNDFKLPINMEYLNSLSEKDRNYILGEMD